jgi:hypothetical protein
MTAEEALASASLEEIRRELDARAPGAPAHLAPPGPPGPLAPVETPQLVEELNVRQRIVYGVDDRKEHYEIAEVAVATNAESTVALFDASAVVDQGDGTSRLVSKSFKDEYGLCDSERFKDQPCGAFCSGFLVGPDLVATAGHCVDPSYLADVTRIRFVFGYRMGGPLDPPGVVSNTEVYRGKTIVGHVLTPTKTDWAVVRLDREVAGHPVARLRRTGSIAAGAPVYVIGHPCGLPLKYAPGATVRGNDQPEFFTANLDTYGGNSGSPVFGANHEVEGILVRGGTDFVWKGHCRVSAVVPTSGGRGEDVTRVSEILPHVPED